MAKKGKFSDKKDSAKPKNRSERRKNEQEQEAKSKLVDGYDENKENDNDFFVEDADDIDLNNVDDAELSGSDLDFDEENDYEKSEIEEEEKSDKEEESKKKFSLTLDTYKNIKKKAKNGSSYHITQCIVIFSKAISFNDDVEVDEVTEDGQLNILANKKYCLKIIKFCLGELMEDIQLKLSKPIIKRLLGVLFKFLKNEDYWDPSLITLAYMNLAKNINLVKMFKSYTEVFIKLSVKNWAEKDESSEFSLTFLKEVAVSGEFDFVIKSCYLGFLSVAKAMNKHSYSKIQRLIENIVDLLKAADQDVGYKNVFLFLRKICIELRRTITDKKWNSIKTIYNWQLINSLLLWSRVLCECYNKNLDSNFKLLAFPLIQIIIGVLRLHFVSNFFPLKLILIQTIIKISEVSGIFIPVSNYLLEILESSIFMKYYKNKPDLFPSQPKEKSKFFKKPKKVFNEEGNNHSEYKAPVEEAFKAENLDYTLKIKEMDNYNVVCEIFKSTLDTLMNFCYIHCHEVTFPELSASIILSLRKINKNITEKVLKEGLKECTDAIQQNSEFIIKKRSIFKSEFNKLESLSKINNKLKVLELPLKSALKQQEVKSKLKSQITNAKSKGEFIDI